MCYLGCGVLCVNVVLGLVPTGSMLGSLGVVVASYCFSSGDCLLVFGYENGRQCRYVSCTFVCSLCMGEWVCNVVQMTGLC